ncbi:MAG: toxin-antitoxin system YwqK family antitoxin, partial [Flavobacteriales bacterium]
VQHGTYKVYYSNGKVAEEAVYRNGEKDGPWRQYFESGKLRGEGTSSTGHFEGKVIYYHPNGVKLIEGEYVRGMKDGTWIKYTSGGDIEVVSSFKMGDLKAERCENGEFMKYFANGIPESEYVYVDGKKDGPFTEWYEQGEFVQVPMDKPKPGGGIQFKQKLEGAQIKRKGDYMNGKLEGEITYYNEDGKIIKIETYENGELISTSN